MNLDDLIRTRRKTGTVASAAAQAVQLATKEVADELFNVHECERPVEAARDRKAFDAATLVLESTKKDHALAVKRLEDRKADHAYADLQARTAAAAVIQCVDEILRDENAARAKRVDDLWVELRREALALKHFCVAAGVHSTGGAVSAATQRVLDRLNTPLLDALNIPINMQQSGDVAAYNDWVARREQMIAGEPERKADAA